MISKKILSLSQFFLLVCFFLFPNLSFHGAKNGVILWIKVVIPSLFPFLLISAFLLQLNLISYITPILNPFFCKLFKCSSNGCYPILIGLLSGYPMGAKACADLVKNHSISKKEGQYLLSFINNASPMFITCYLSCQCLKLAPYRYVIYLAILFSSYLVSLLYRFLLQKNVTPHTVGSSPSNCNKISLSSISQALDASIADSFQTVTKIGGYIILFSILGEYILALPNTLGTLRYYFISLLEITSAVNQISLANFPYKAKIILALTTTTLGGLSGIFQTYSVIANSGLSIKTYCFSKLLQTILLFLILCLTFIFY